MRQGRLCLAAVLCCGVLAAGASRAVRAETAGNDPYETYVKTSKDFKPVKQDKDFLYKQYPSWTYMPWYYKWTIGFGEAGGKFSQEMGYNGGFTDHGDASHLDFFNTYKLRFYVDHTASKRFLHLWDGNEMKQHAAALNGTGVRPVQLNAATEEKLKGIIKTNISHVMSSPMRAAYALDDEVSWGGFVKPCMWRVNDDEAAYKKWLDEVYGAGKAPKHSGWIGYNAVWPKLDSLSLKTFDVSQLMDQWTYNDSVWCDLLGDLVEYANSVDPEVPCGFVGGQNPSPFGFDYAKIMRKIQYIEAYNMGSSQAIIRSFSPHNAIPAVTTHFNSNSNDSIWQFYYYVAHGNRGHIGWVEKWFDGVTPKSWHKEISPALLECGRKLGPLQAQSEWIHDGVAVYYSQASIQLGWIMDAAAHKNTWTNRNNDHRLGASHMVRHAWENMLRDEGIQYNFLSYVDVIQNGIPKEYKVLILPAALCLSDAEARKIEEFCKAGGTVIADYLPGCWDQHGKGRAEGGALDEMFGVKHSPALRASDVFMNKGWYEVNQDDNFSWKTYNEFMTKDNSCVKDASGFNKAVKTMDVNHVNKFGQGTAVLMNLSPQWYNAYRESGFEAAKKRSAFMKHVEDAGVKRWVEIKNAGEKEFGYEITYWKKGDRTLLFLVSNPEVLANSLGGGNSAGLKTDTVEITLKFAKPVSGVKDERTGKELGNGDAFKFTWKMNEAVVLSFTSGK